MKFCQYDNPGLFLGWQFAGATQIQPFAWHLLQRVGLAHESPFGGPVIDLQFLKVLRKWMRFGK